MGIRPTIDTLRELQAIAPDGRRSLEFLDALDEHYNDLVRKIQASNAKGSLTIKLTVSPVKGNADMVTIDAAIDTKPPVRAAGASLFYTTPEGNTQTRNPRQRDAFGVKEIEGDHGETISVDTETGEVRQVGE